MKYVFYLVILIILYIAGVMIYNNYDSQKETTVQETKNVELEIQNSETTADSAIDNTINSAEKDIQNSINSTENSLASVMK